MQSFFVPISKVCKNSSLISRHSSYFLFNFPGSVYSRTVILRSHVLPLNVFSTIIIIIRHLDPGGRQIKPRESQVYFFGEKFEHFEMERV